MFLLLLITQKNNAIGGSASTNTGYNSAAISSGNESVAINSGNCGVAISEGKNSFSISTGINGISSGKLGCYIACAEWVFDDKTHELKVSDFKTVKVDGKSIKEDTFYRLVNGKFEEVN